MDRKCKSNVEQNREDNWNTDCFGESRFIDVKGLGCQIRKQFDIKVLSRKGVKIKMAWKKKLALRFRRKSSNGRLNSVEDLTKKTGMGN